VLAGPLFYLLGFVKKALRTLFKHFRKRNYSIKKLKISIFNTLITLFLKKLLFKSLKSASEAMGA